jgi:hypothetical protein
VTTQPSLWSRIGGPLAQRPQSPLEYVAWALGLVTAAYTAYYVPPAAGWVLAIALPLTVLRFPVAGLALIAVLAEEINDTGDFGSLTRLGYQLFFSPGKVPVIVLVAVTAVCAALARSRPLRLPRAGLLDMLLLGSIGGLILLSFGTGVLQGQSVFSAVNQNSRSFVLLALGCLAGITLRGLKDEPKSLRGTVGLGLIFLAVAASVAIPFGEGADDRISAYFIYYDSALPAVAAAVLIAILGMPGHDWGKLEVALLLTAPFLILISFRRSVWLAAAVVFVLSVVLMQWRRFARLSARMMLATVATALIVLASPGFAADLGQRSGADSLTAGSPTFLPGHGPSPQPEPTSAATTPASTAPSAPAKPVVQPSEATQAEKSERQAESDRGHLGDLKLGWQYAEEHFWTGVGAVSPQLAGLAADEATRIYVHNEVLQVWLRYGVFGPLLIGLLFLAAGLKSLAALRDRDSDVVVRSAAAFCLICPPCMMTAPFLSETNRWPLLMGIAAGILVLRGPRPDAEVAPSVAVGPPRDGTAMDATIKLPRISDATVEFSRHDQ